MYWPTMKNLDEKIPFNRTRTLIVAHSTRNCTSTTVYKEHLKTAKLDRTCVNNAYNYNKGCVA
jgi:hypothetical protein